MCERERVRARERESESVRVKGGERGRVCERDCASEREFVRERV